MLEYDRFAEATKDYTVKCDVDFAECKTEQKSVGKNTIVETLEYMVEQQKPLETTAKVMPNTANTAQEDSVKQPLMPREASETPMEGITAVTTLDSMKSHERAYESTQDKHNMSNFANAKIF